MAFRRVFSLSKFFPPPGVKSCHSGTGRRWHEATTPPRSFTWLHYGVKTLIRRQEGPTFVKRGQLAYQMPSVLHWKWCTRSIAGRKFCSLNTNLSSTASLAPPSFVLAWISEHGVSLGNDYLQGKQDGKRIFIYDFIRAPSLHSSDLIKFIFRQPALISIKFCSKFRSNKGEFYKIEGKVANVLQQW